MKKFSVLLGMLLYAFAWMINSVSAQISSTTIIFPDNSAKTYQNYGFDIKYNDGSSSGADKFNYSGTEAPAGTYKIQYGSLSATAKVNGGNDLLSGVSFGNTIDIILSAGDILEIKFSLGAYTATVTISVPAPTSTPTPISTSTPVPTSTPTLTTGVIEATAVPTAYIYPEDEYGLYYLLADGKKEYIMYHNYDICLFFMEHPDECEYYRR